MAAVRLRLFAAARDAAGRSEDTVEADTLGELHERIAQRYGEAFVRVLRTSRVWINGAEVPAGDATVLSEGDEVAVLPPVSGG